MHPAKCPVPRRGELSTQRNGKKKNKESESPQWILQFRDYIPIGQMIGNGVHILGTVVCVCVCVCVWVWFDFYSRRREDTHTHTQTHTLTQLVSTQLTPSLQN